MGYNDIEQIYRRLLNGTPLSDADAEIVNNALRDDPRVEFYHFVYLICLLKKNRFEIFDAHSKRVLNDEFQIDNCNHLKMHVHVLEAVSFYLKGDHRSAFEVIASIIHLYVSKGHVTSPLRRLPFPFKDFLNEEELDLLRAILNPVPIVQFYHYIKKFQEAGRYPYSDEFPADSVIVKDGDHVPADVLCTKTPLIIPGMTVFYQGVYLVPDSSYYARNQFHIGTKDGLVNKTRATSIPFHMPSSGLLEESFFRWLALKRINRPSRISLAIVEKGRTLPSLEARGALHMKLLVEKTDRRKKKKTVTVSSSAGNNVVLACVHCDCLLQSKNVLCKVNEWNLETCPYCKKPLEYYWRDGKVYEVSLCQDEAAWNLLPGKERGSVLVDICGVPRPVKVTSADITGFMVLLADQLTNHAIGPFTLQVAYGYKPTIDQSYYHYQENYVLSPSDEPITISSGSLNSMDLALIKNSEVIYKATTVSKRKQESASAEAFLQQKERVIAARTASKEARKNARERNKLAREKEEARKVQLAASIASFWSTNGFSCVNNVVDGVYWRSIKAERMDSGYYASRWQSKYPKRRDAQSVEYHFILTNESGVEVESFIFTEQEFRSYIAFLQNNLKDFFSEIKMFVMESTVQYEQGPVHQYLKLILDTPGTRVKVAKASRDVSACANCDAMLLRYSYDWVMQRDDLALPSCPYCNAPLAIIQRKPKLQHVMLDFTAANCRVTGANSQIGVIYNKIPIKLTVKVASMVHYLQNLQQNFPHSSFGPLKITLSYDLSKISNAGFKGSIIHKIETGSKKILIDWRPIILFPEDLIAF